MSDNNSFDKKIFIELPYDNRVNESVRYAINKVVEYFGKDVGSEDIQRHMITCFEQCRANLTLVVGAKADDNDFQKIFNLGFSAGNGVGRNVFLD